MSAIFLFLSGPVEILLTVISVSALAAGLLYLLKRPYSKLEKQLGPEDCCSGKPAEGEPDTETDGSNVRDYLTESDILQLNRFVGLLSEHVCDPTFKVDQYAAKMCMDRSTLYVHLKMTTGMSALQIITGVRIMMSKVLLVVTDKGLSEISSMVGYSDATTLCAKFKAETAMTPNQYRVGWRKGRIEESNVSAGIYFLELCNGNRLEIDVRKMVDSRL